MLSLDVTEEGFSVTSKHLAERLVEHLVDLPTRSPDKVLDKVPCTQSPSSTAKSVREDRLFGLVLPEDEFSATSKRLFEHLVGTPRRQIDKVLDEVLDKVLDKVPGPQSHSSTAKSVNECRPMSGRIRLVRNSLSR